MIVLWFTWLVPMLDCCFIVYSKLGFDVTCWFYCICLLEFALCFGFCICFVVVSCFVLFCCFIVTWYCSLGFVVLVPFAFWLSCYLCVWVVFLFCFVCDFGLFSSVSRLLVCFVVFDFTCLVYFGLDLDFVDVHVARWIWCCFMLVGYFWVGGGTVLFWVCWDWFCFA